MRPLLLYSRSADRQIDNGAKILVVEAAARTRMRGVSGTWAPGHDGCAHGGAATVRPRFRHECNHHRRPCEVVPERAPASLCSTLPCDRHGMDFCEVPKLAAPIHAAAGDAALYRSIPCGSQDGCRPAPACVAIRHRPRGGTARPFAARWRRKSCRHAFEPGSNHEDVQNRCSIDRPLRLVPAMTAASSRVVRIGADPGRYNATGVCSCASPWPGLRGETAGASRAARAAGQWHRCQAIRTTNL